MSGRRAARPAGSEQTGPAPAGDLAGAAAVDLSGLRADLLRSRGSSTEVRWADEGPAWHEDAHTWQEGPSALWVEDPVSAPGGHVLHPDDLAVLHDLPDAAPTVEPGPEPEAPSRPATRAERRQAHRGPADGPPLWSDPDEDAPSREPAPRGRVDREDRARAPRWAVVLAAVLALLVGAALTALVTEGQVRSARQETAEAVSAAQDARESADRARTALQESEELAGLTAPEPRDPEPLDEGLLENGPGQDRPAQSGAAQDRAAQDGAAQDGAAQDGDAAAVPAPPVPRSTRSTEQRLRESAPAPGSSAAAAPDAAALDDPSDQETGPAKSAAGLDGSSEEGAAADAGCTGEPAAEGGPATGGDGGDTCP